MRWAPLLLVLNACGTPGGAPPDAHAGDTWRGGVGALVLERCAGCHRAGGIGPFELTSADHLRENARAVRDAIVAGRMPPWGVVADGSCGDFVEPGVLHDDERARLLDWLHAGAPEGAGDAPDLPRPAALRDEPTVLAMAAGYPLDRMRGDDYRCFVVPNPVAATKLVTAFRAEPGVAAAVHHLALWSIAPARVTGSLDNAPATNAQFIAALEQQDDRPGWECYSVAGAGVAPDQLVVAWAPGLDTVRFPEGTALALRPDRMLVLQVHYHSSSPLELQDRTRLVLETVDAAEPARTLLVDGLLDTRSTTSPHVLVPGRRGLEFTWERTFAELGRELDTSGAARLVVHGAFPHMHSAGRTMRLELVRNGASACVTSLASWNPDWQRFYFFEAPLELEPGDVLRATCTYDTTARSLPTKPGFGSADEMCAVELYATVP